MPSLCQVRADTNLAIEKFYFSICLALSHMLYANGFSVGYIMPLG